MTKHTIDKSNADLHQGGFVGDGGFYVRPMTLSKGSVHKGHSHYIDHVGNLVSGAVRVHWRREDGSAEGVTDVLVPAKILVRADTWHQIEALENSVWECWFSRAEADAMNDDAKGSFYLEKPCVNF